MTKALKDDGRFLPAHAEPAVVLQPGDGSLHRPAALVSAQVASILSLVLGFAVGAMRRNHFHLQGGEFVVQGVRVIGFVAHQLFGKVETDHEVEERRDQSALMGAGAARLNRDRQPSGVDHHHNLHALAGLGAANSVAPTFRLREGAIKVTLIELESLPLLDDRSHGCQEDCKGSAAHPSLKGPVHRTLGSERARQVLPFRPIVQDPEDAGDGFALVPCAGGHPTVVRDDRAKEHKAYLTLIQKGAAFLTQN